MIEALVSFSNSRGGSVLIGVSNNKNIVGVSINDETIQKWINEIKQNTSPAILPIVNVFEVEGKKIVKLHTDKWKNSILLLSAKQRV